MKEINRFVVDSIQLRIMNYDGKQWCEILESNRWSRVSAVKLHQLSFDKKVYGWLNQHYYSTNFTHNFYDNNKNEFLRQNNKVENKKQQVFTFAAFLLVLITVSAYFTIDR
jgi:hypothetical protein